MFERLRRWIRGKKQRVVYVVLARNRSALNYHLFLNKKKAKVFAEENKSSVRVWKEGDSISTTTCY